MPNISKKYAKVNEQMKYKIIIHNLTKEQAETIRDGLQPHLRPEILNDWTE